MGFPLCYAELPNLFLHALILLGSIRRIISWAFSAVGLGDLLEPDTPWPEPALQSHCQSRCRPAISALMEELMPAAQFAELSLHAESCAVCLHELEGSAEVRRLRSCGHVFHRCCLDPWVEHGQRTCPLCRSPVFQSDEMLYDFDGRDLAVRVYDSFLTEFSS